MKDRRKGKTDIRMVRYYRSDFQTAQRGHREMARRLWLPSRFCRRGSSGHFARPARHDHDFWVGHVRGEYMYRGTVPLCQHLLCKTPRRHLPGSIRLGLCKYLSPHPFQIALAHEKYHSQTRETPNMLSPLCLECRTHIHNTTHLLTLFNDISASDKHQHPRDSSIMQRD